MKDTLTREGPNSTDDIERGNGAGKYNSEHGDLTTGLSQPFGQREAVLLAPRRRRWRILVPVLLAAAIIVAVIAVLASPPKGPATAQVRRGTIISSVETTGKLEAQTSARLSFRTSGRVERVIAKQGDRVKAGQVLAELESDNLQRQLREAQAQSQISHLRLQQAELGPRQEDITAATADLSAAKAQLEQLKGGGRPEDITAAQAALNQAQARLDGLKKGASPQELTAAQARLDQAKANRDLTAATSSNATEQARILYVQAQSAAEDFLDPAGQLEQARLNYEAAQKSETAQMASTNARVTEAQAALDTLKAGATPEEIRVAEQGVVQAQAHLDKVRNGATQQDIATAQARVDVAQANLDKLNSGPTDTDISILRQQVTLSQISVERAEAQLAEAQIVAPMDGTVLSIDLEVGEIVNGSQPVATVADTTSLRIKADVDEIDVGRVQAGQAVTVTLDAYPGVRLPGRIESLAPGATLKQGSTVYQATVSFVPSGEVVPREGMAANVDITAQRKDDVLLLPNRALEAVGRRQYVTVKRGDTTARIEIETGLSNNTDTEIISGLEEGETVLLK
ncbi:MAG TPA: HlyD family efflux transporter periplasmic adaptor subunit [Chloroflexia bacterium]|jgi:HlyD family secretion protein